MFCLIFISKQFDGTSQMGLLDYNTSDGRFLFMLPWEGHTLIGTTDTKGPVRSKPISISRKDYEPNSKSKQRCAICNPDFFFLLRLDFLYDRPKHRQDLQKKKLNGC